MLIAAARLLGNLLRLPLLPLWWLGRLVGRPRGDWLSIRLRPRLVELPRIRPFLARWIPGVARVLPTPLSALHRLAELVGADPHLRGVVVEIPHMHAGWAQCAGVRDAIARMRDRGVRVVAYLPQGGGSREMWVASSAERVLLGRQATLIATGLSIESRYLKPLLDKLGIAVRPMAQGEYKSAAENLARDSMSEPQREQLSALLATLERALVGGIASLPGMDEERARALFDRGLVRGEDAVEAGFASGLCYEDELPLALTEDDRPAKLVPAGRYLSFHEARFFSRVLRRPYVAVVDVHGPIVSDMPGLGRSAADPASLAAALRAVRRDRFAAGVVLHVSSPGGSAVASDLIHREVVRLREKKPVVACFGDVAASGGYYVAAPAHAIVAQPVTITGSIGVVSAKVVAAELLESVGVRTETLRSAPHADMFSPARELSEEERGIVDRELAAFYRVFVSIVAEGRGRPVEEIEPLARGRVWSGADAHERGLVDRLGGLDAAVEEVRARAAVPERLRRSLAPRRVRPRRFDLPPAEPPSRAAAALALAGRLAPEAVALLDLLASGDRVLYYAPDLPRVD